MNKIGFSDGAQQLLGAARISCHQSVTELDPEALIDRGINFCVTDFDGVLSPYGQPVSDDKLDWLTHMDKTLPKGIGIVTNNPSQSLEGSQLPPRISLHTSSLRAPWLFKPSPFLVRAALRSHDATTKETVAVGDGCTDLLAYKLARIQHIGIVETLGAHYLQELVHKRIYAPLFVPLGSRALSLASTFSKRL